MKIDLGIVVTAVNQATSGLKAVSGDIVKMGQDAKNTENRLRAIQVVLASIAVAKSIEFGEKFLKAAGDVEQLRLRLGFAMGSMKDAGEVIEELNRKFGGTGIENFANKLTGVFTDLLGSGMPRQRAMELVEAMGQIAIVSGKDDAAIQTLGSAFQKMAVSGKTGMRTIANELKAIPEAVNVMAAAWGKGEKTVADFVAAVEDGAITANEAFGFFIEGTTKRFGNAAAMWQGTIRGTLAGIKEVWEDSIRSLTTRFPINDAVSTRLQAIRAAMDNIVSQITLQQVERFFEVLDNVARAAQNVIAAVMPLIGAVIAFGEAAAKFIGSLAPEVVTAGIVGYLFFGRLGMLGAASIVAAANKYLGDTKALVDEASKYFSAALPLGLLGLAIFGPKGAAVAVLLGAGADYAITQWALATERTLNKFGSGDTTVQDRFAKGQTAFKSIAIAMGLVEAESKKAEGSVGSIGAAVEVSGDKFETAAGKAGQFAAALGAIDQTARHFREMDQSFEKISGPFDKIRDTNIIAQQKLAGDVLGQTIGEINKRYTEQQHALKTLIPLVKEHGLTYKDARGPAALQLINAELAKAEQLHTRELQRARELYVLRQQVLINEQLLLQNRTQQGVLALQQFNNDPLKNLFSMGGGELVNQTLQQRLSLQQQILQAEQAILAARKEMEANAADSKVVDQLRKTIAAHDELIMKTREALAGLSASATAQNQLWTDVGNSIFGNLGGHISGLITKTTTWQQVTVSMFQSITKAAADYLVKLMMIQLVGGGMGGGGGMSGIFGSIFGAMFGLPSFSFAKGGVFQGHVKPFADGDIIRGPTMFGLAGEAGTEAIMPLTRIGGKLGVRSSGGGGAHYSINISAIDTQSGVEFLMKNEDVIFGRLSQRDRLHRGHRGDAR